MSLAICSSGHEEVCYESRNCPACEALDDLRAQKDKEIARLEERWDTHDCEAQA